MNDAKYATDLASQTVPLHTIDLIRKKRDGGTLSDSEIRFLVAGAANCSIPLEQLSAWLMASLLRGLGLDEIRAFRAEIVNEPRRFGGVPSHHSSPSWTAPLALTAVVVDSCRRISRWA